MRCMRSLKQKVTTGNIAPGMRTYLIEANVRLEVASTRYYA